MPAASARRWHHPSPAAPRSARAAWSSGVSTPGKNRPLGGISTSTLTHGTPSDMQSVVSQRGSAIPAGMSLWAVQYGFTGYISDCETCLLHARTRMYSPGIGRFTTSDKLTFLSRAGVWIPDGIGMYINGFNLYGAYFVPYGLDSDGLFTRDRGELQKQISELACKALAGTGVGKDRTEFGWEWSEDASGNLMAGSTVTGPVNSSQVDTHAGTQPAGASGGPIGDAHTHPSGGSASSTDTGVWWDERQENNKSLLNTVFLVGEDCCNGDPKKYGMLVEVWIWSSKSNARPNPSTADHPAATFGRMFRECSAAGGADKDCSRKAMAAAADELKRKGVLEDF